MNFLYKDRLCCVMIFRVGVGKELRFFGVVVEWGRESNFVDRFYIYELNFV